MATIPPLGIFSERTYYFAHHTGDSRALRRQTVNVVESRINWHSLEIDDDGSSTTH